MSALHVAAVLTFALGLAHSYLGERYLLRRLFRRADLPAILGGPQVTVRVLRFAWHLTSVAWWGLGVLLWLLATPPLSAHAVGNVIGWTFLVHAVVICAAAGRRHLAWIVFLAIAVLTFWATHAVDGASLV